MRAGVVLAQIMRIVGGHQRNAGLRGQAVDHGEHARIRLQAVVLQFQEEILRAEQVGVFVGQALGFFVTVRQQGLIDVAAQARRQRDQALGMPRQQVLIDARLVIEPVQVAGGNQLDQVAIAFLVLAQQHQVVVAVGVALDGVALLRDVHLAADHRMDALLPWRCCKTRPRRTDCRGRSWPRRASSARPRGPSTARFRRRRRAANNRCGNADGQTAGAWNSNPGGDLYYSGPRVPTRATYQIVGRQTDVLRDPSSRMARFPPG